MKKNLIIFILLFTLITTLTGCKSWDKMAEDNFPGMEYQWYLKTTDEASLALINSNITDIAAFSAQTRNVAYSLVEDKIYDVTFLYEEEDGRVVELPQIEWRQEYMNSKEYPELVKAGLTNRVLELVKENDLGPGNVVATTLKWKKNGLDGGIKEKYILCDFDGDGTWDYLANDFASFGETTREGYPTREFEYDKVSFIYEKDIVELSDLTGDEKIRDFQKLL